jgi:hypothetical protein
MSIASSHREPAPLSPRDLADWLDQWALRREKVLHLIDIQGARECRHLASRCRTLAHSQRTQPPEWWRREWASLRLEVATFLSRGARFAPHGRGTPVPVDSEAAPRSGPALRR